MTDLVFSAHSKYFHNKLIEIIKYGFLSTIQLDNWKLFKHFRLMLSHHFDVELLIMVYYPKPQSRL